MYRQVSGHKKILQDNPTLRQRLMIREAYITPLNLQQVYTLKKMRSKEAGGKAEGAAQDKAPSKVTLLNPNREFGDGIEDTLIITMKGIAAGMQNTG